MSVLPAKVQNCAKVFGFPFRPDKCVLSGCLLHLFDVFLEYIVFNQLYLSYVTELCDS